MCEVAQHKLLYAGTQCRTPQWQAGRSKIRHISKQVLHRENYNFKILVF